jgi:hypothetical protein
MFKSESKSKSNTAKSESKSCGSQTNSKSSKIGLKSGLEAHSDSSHYITGNWDKETSSRSLGTFGTNLYFASCNCSASNRLFFTQFARERGFTAIAVLLVCEVRKPMLLIPKMKIPRLALEKCTELHKI